jgi:hypothetical protein
LIVKYLVYMHSHLAVEGELGSAQYAAMVREGSCQDNPVRSGPDIRSWNAASMPVPDGIRMWRSERQFLTDCSLV